MPSCGLVGLAQLPVLALQRVGFAALRVSFAATSVGTLASTSAFFTHSFSVCAAQLILAEIDSAAAQRDP
jgi:hypothetical protein